jgi:hypothetical protein
VRQTQFPEYRQIKIGHVKAAHHATKLPSNRGLVAQFPNSANSEILTPNSQKMLGRIRKTWDWRLSGKEEGKRLTQIKAARREPGKMGRLAGRKSASGREFFAAGGAGEATA